MICAMEFVNFENDELYMGDVVPGVAYNDLDAQRARRILTLDRHLMRLGLTGSLKDHMMEERADKLRQLPPGFDLDRFARFDRETERVSANEKGILHNVKQVFHPGAEDDNSGWYWRTRPAVMRKRAAELEIEHDRWLPPKRQKELQAEREEKRQEKLRAEREASKW